MEFGEITKNLQTPSAILPFIRYYHTLVSPSEQQISAVAMASAPKRRLVEDLTKSGPLEDDQDDVIFLAKHEPEEAKRNHLVKLLIGTYEQLCTRKAIQDLLPDPSYFQSTVNPQGNECRLILPEGIDAWAVNVVLMAVLNEGVPLDCKSPANGLTLQKLHQAAGFLKVDGNRIGLPARQNEEVDAGSGPQVQDNIRPEANAVAVNHPVLPQSQPHQTDETKTVIALQYNLRRKFNKPKFLNLPLSTVLNLVKKSFLDASEYTIYRALLTWCKHDYPSRWTKEICDALFTEVRWDLDQYELEQGITTETSPLRDTLLDLKTTLFPAGRLTAQPGRRSTADHLYLFYSDGCQVDMVRYDWAAHRFWDMLLPRETKHWTLYSEIAPGMEEDSILFRVVNDHHFKTYSYELASKRVRYLFEQQADSCEGYPVVCLNGIIYGWDFVTKSSKHNQSLKFHPHHLAITHDMKKPKFFRKKAAFASWNGKFYYCGGIQLNDKSGTAVATVEMYDASTDKWTTLPNMQYPRRCFTALVCNDQLYVTGGASSAKPSIHKSCERLNLSVTGAEWELIASLASPRYSHFMFEINGHPHVAGGYRSRGQSAHWVDAYDTVRNCWETVDDQFSWPWTFCVQMKSDDSAAP